MKKLQAIVCSVLLISPAEAKPYPNISVFALRNHSGFMMIDKGITHIGVNTRSYDLISIYGCNAGSCVRLAAQGREFSEGERERLEVNLEPSGCKLYMTAPIDRYGFDSNNWVVSKSFIEQKACRGLPPSLAGLYSSICLWFSDNETFDDMAPAGPACRKR